MVATSNRHPSDLYKKGLNRSLFVPFIQELERRCEVWELEGDQDYRMTTAQQAADRQQVVFTQKEEFRESLTNITGGLPLEPITIPVLMSRRIRVDATVLENKNVVVHSSFQILCEANLGSPDYHALCKTADVLYLSGLRQFRADELDFVRRFVTLVDLAYESKTRIVCLSDVPLSQVFRNILSTDTVSQRKIEKALEEMNVRGKGGSSSSMMSTFIGDTEWSATGLREASLASGGAGETDVRFAIGRAVSRLFEMGSKAYGVED